jgi:hypothetical protein
LKISHNSITPLLRELKNIAIQQGFNITVNKDIYGGRNMVARLKTIELDIHDTDVDIYKKIVKTFATYIQRYPEEKFEYPTFVSLFMGEGTTQL